VGPSSFGTHFQPLCPDGECLKSGGEFSDATDDDRENLKELFRSMRGKER
jgi:hypothetical protein